MNSIHSGRGCPITWGKTGTFPLEAGWFCGGPMGSAALDGTWLFIDSPDANVRDCNSIEDRPP
jgi:hypothetical protein